jgi:hypothetical protein
MLASTSCSSLSDASPPLALGLTFQLQSAHPLDLKSAAEAASRIAHLPRREQDELARILSDQFPLQHRSLLPLFAELLVEARSWDRALFVSDLVRLFPLVDAPTESEERVALHSARELLNLSGAERAEVVDFIAAHRGHQSAGQLVDWMISLCRTPTHDRAAHADELSSVGGFGDRFEARLSVVMAEPPRERPAKLKLFDWIRSSLGGLQQLARH